MPQRAAAPPAAPPRWPPPPAAARGAAAKGRSSSVEQPALKVPSGATVREVAETFGVGSADVIKQLMQLGEMATLTQTLSDETVEVLADALDRKVEIVSAAEEVAEEPVFEDADGDLVDRPPVVTIMGHVDHGKTSLLDAIRETEVAAGEAGGHHPAHRRLPGAPATARRSPSSTPRATRRSPRCAPAAPTVTDIVVIVVAADDGVMPQTVEAIDHAKAADVPMLVAVNKIDLAGANPDKVKGELATQGLNPEDWGGDTIFVNVSAKTHEDLDELLEMHPARRRGRGAQGQPGRAGLGHR